jgi:hypothetical protein
LCLISFFNAFYSSLGSRSMFISYIHVP